MDAAVTGCMVLCCAEDAMLFGVNRFDSFTPSPVQVLPCTWLVYWTVIFSLQGWMKDKEPYKLKWAVVSHPFFFPFYVLRLSFSFFLTAKIKRKEKISMRMHKTTMFEKMVCHIQTLDTHGTRWRGSTVPDHTHLLVVAACAFFCIHLVNFYY